MSSACEPSVPWWWRLAARALVTAGWVYGCTTRPYRTRRQTRRVEFGPVTLRVRQTWGDFEPSPEGDFVLRSVPTRYFIYGDSLWYGNVAEIRLRPPDHPTRLLAEGPMDEMQRLVRTDHGEVLVLLRVARGMSHARRAEAERAFRSVRRRRRGEKLRYPERTYGVPARPSGQPPKDSRRYFEGGSVGA